MGIQLTEAHRAKIAAALQREAERLCAEIVEGYARKIARLLAEHGGTVH